MTHINGSARATILNIILNLKLLSLQVKYMGSEQTAINRLTESRFELIIFFFRLAGIPLYMKKISTIYAIYMSTMILCACTTFLGMLVDIFVHRDDLVHVMKNVRMFISTTNVVWMYLYCR